MPVVYTITVNNLGNTAGTTVEVWDWIPDWVEYGGGGTYNAGLVTWSIPQIDFVSNASVWFTGTLSCFSGGIVNNQYYFINSSDQGITSTYGAPVAFTVVTPTIVASFDASSLSVLEGETVTFTGTAFTNGGDLSYAWDFGDGGIADGMNASHAYGEAGSYAVTLMVVDGCGYSAEYSLTVDVVAGTISVYLPVVRK
jgi:PKD repeat protein